MLGWVTAWEHHKSLTFSYCLFFFLDVFVCVMSESLEKVDNCAICLHSKDNRQTEHQSVVVFHKLAWVVRFDFIQEVLDNSFVLGHSQKDCNTGPTRDES